MKVCIVSLSLVLLLSTFVASDIPWWSSLKSNNGSSTKTVILTIVNRVEKLDEYKLALETVNCYANLRGYSHKALILDDTNGIKGVHLEDDATIVLPSVHNQSKKCNHRDFFFRRHCIVALYMEENKEKFSLVLFMDADVGVVNPNHLIHEYLPSCVPVEMVFYNRLFLYEIAAGGYLARNTNYSRQFLHYWADCLYKLPEGFVGTDNGAIHVVFMEKLARDRRKCEYYSNRTKDWEKLFDFEACVRDYFGLNETLYTEYDSQGHVRGRVSIRPFGKSWVRDSGLTQSRFSHDDFMFHQWKTSNMDKPLPNADMAEWVYPFRDKDFSMQKCLEGSTEPWVPKVGLFVAQSQIDHELSKRIEAVNGGFQYNLNKMKTEDTTRTSTTTAIITTKIEELIKSRIATAEQNRELMTSFGQDSVYNATSPMPNIGQSNNVQDGKENSFMAKSNISTKNSLSIPIATLVGWAEAGKAPKKFPISQSLDRNNSTNPWLTQGCKEWEGNCDRKYNKTGSCKNDSVICDEGYYRGNPTFDDTPGMEYCYEEKDRPYTCVVVTTTTTRPHTTTTRAPRTTTTSQQPQTTMPPRPSCPQNEIYVVDSKCLDMTCAGLNGGKQRSGAPCNARNTTITPRCMCETNFARNDDDICVPERYCNNPPPVPCTPHSYYEDCPQCQDLKCSDIKRFDASVPAGQEKPSMSHRYCLDSACVCEKGYARDEDENCAEIVGVAPNACA